jgi:hypothetical protein
MPTDSSGEIQPKLMENLVAYKDPPVDYFFMDPIIF